MKVKVGCWLGDHFYRKHCGKPMRGLENKGERTAGWFYLNTEEVCRVTPKVLRDMQELGVECAEIACSLRTLESMVSSLKERGNIELILQFYHTM